MAFTTLQKAKIRTYLGYPSIYLTSNPLVEGSLDTIGQDPDVSAFVLDTITKLEDVELKLSTTGLDVAGISSAGTGDPEFYKGQTQVDLRNEGRRLVSKLSINTGIPVANDIFGNAGLVNKSMYQANVIYGLANGF